MYFVFPLFLTQTIYFLNTEKELSGLNFKSIFIQNKNNYYSCLSLICCIAGYLFNNLILSRIYTFSSYNTTTFTRIGDVTFSDLHSFFLRFLGYKNEVSVFTPSGIINILLYVFYVSFFIILIKELKWLTPARYYTENFGENQKVFFIVLNIEYNQTPEANIFLNGDLIYTDNKYRIYQYDSNIDFINSFTSTKD